MPKFVIERTVPGAGSLSDEQIKGMSSHSNEVIAGMGGRAQWQHSYVTDDKIYCVYIADDEAAVREHAEKGGFPAESVAAVRRIIDPASAD